MISFDHIAAMPLRGIPAYAKDPERAAESVRGQRTMDVPEKAGKLVAYLEERLASGEYPVGSRIPSVRSLAERFAISYGTALRGVNVLCARGRLQKRSQRGIYVSDTASRQLSPGVRRIAVFMEPYVKMRLSGMCYTAFLGMQQIALTAGYTFIVNPLMVEDAPPQVVATLSDGAAGIIFLNEYDLHMAEFRATVPTVGILMQNSYGGTISTVNLDPLSSALLAADYFSARGCRTVSIISSPKPVFASRGRSFATVWRERGFACDLTLAGYGEVIGFDRHCGYLFTSDQFAQHYSAQYREQTGRPLESDHVVLGMDGKQLIDPDFRGFASIAVDWRSIGQVAFNECLQRIEDPTNPPKNITLTGKPVGWE